LSQELLNLGLGGSDHFDTHLSAGSLLATCDEIAAARHLGNFLVRYLVHGDVIVHQMVVIKHDKSIM
jgi:hypothetical protein